MPKFRFLHAADLHLDSPLLGLTRKSADYAERVDDASRRAFDNLIALAIEEQCHSWVTCRNWKVHAGAAVHTPQKYLGSCEESRRGGLSGRPRASLA